MAEQITDAVNEKYGTSIHVSKVGLSWTGRVSLQNVLIQDHKQDTLIYTKRLRTRLKNVKPLLQGHLYFRHTYLTDPYFHIKTYKGEEKSTIEIFADNFGEGSGADNPFTLFFSRLILDNGNFVITNENLERSNVFSMDSVYLKTDNFKLVKDVIDSEIQKLAFKSFDGLEVIELSGDYHYSPTGMGLKKMDLQTKHSHLKGAIQLDYPMEGLSEFSEVVQWTFDIEPSQISSNDIRVFYSNLGANITFNIATKMRGTLLDFKVEENSIAFRNTSIVGDFNFKDLLDADSEFQIQSDSHVIKTNTSDLEHLLPTILRGVIPKEVRKLGNVTLQGKSRISDNAIQTNGTWNTAIGIAKIDLDLSDIKDFENAFYHGEIDLRNFDAGKLLNNKNIGKISSKLKVDGKGTQAKTLDTEIEAEISTFIVNNYNYTNVWMEGELKYPFFNGVALIKDRNLDMDFNGLIDMSDVVNEYDFEATVNFSDLNQLGLVKRDSIAEFTGKVVMDMQGTSVDDVVGELNFKETFYQTYKKYYYFDDFAISSTFEDDQRTIAINSPDIVTGYLTGHFTVRDLPQLIRNGIGSIYTNYIPEEVTQDQYISFDFEIHNKIVDVFIPQLEIGDNTRLKGEVSSDDKTFILDFVSPEIMAFNNHIEKINLHVDYDNPMHNTYLTVGTINNKIYTINGLEIDNTTKNDTLAISANFRGGKDQGDYFDLSFYHTINPAGQSVFGIKRSGILFDNNLWYVNHENDDRNRVVLENKFETIRIDSLVLNHNDEYIRMAGVVRDSTYKDVHLNFENVKLSHLIRDVDSLDVRGKVNGNLNLKQEKGNYYPSSTIRVDGLVLNDVTYGDFALNIIGNENLTRYDIEGSLIEDNKKHFSILGYIDISDGNPNMNVNLDFDAFDIGGFSPFGAHVITKLRGMATGRIQLSGNPIAPEALGRLYLNESGMLIPYLNVDYKLGDNTELVVSKNSWQIANASITDTKYNSQGTLKALVTHNNFKNINFDMRINANEMLVLDTTNEEDALYYGTAFISGQAVIYGPAKELTIDVTATTEKNTNFTIPLSDAESIGDDSFIVFLSPEDKEKRLTGGLVTKEVKGLSVNFDLDINKNAEVHVVVDKVNNSTLRARGFGTLLIQLNTLGKFNMEGDFQVTDGDFDFRYAGIIQKLIKVVPGGFISWDGNPERATINLQTKYETDANPSVLLDNTSINRTIPVEVLIDLSGQLTQPDLTFDIEFPRVSSSVKSELEYKLQNREERDKQALFLIASGSFVNDNFQGANAFSGTLTDKVSGLLNELFADKDGKFTVGLDYTQGSNLPNQETADRFGVTLSTHINERILINGKVGVPVGGIYENSIAGDIDVQWLVNEDGSLRLIFFNRQADIQFLGENQIFEQGAGISYSVDFATFRELVKKLFNKTIELESKKELEVTPDDNTFPIEYYLNDKARLPEENL